MVKKSNWTDFGVSRTILH